MNVLRRSSVFSLLALALAAIYHVQPLSAQQFTVQGQIIEAGRTQSPLAGATVTLGNRPGILSDANGRFRISNVAAGRYLLSLRALGYATAELTLVVTRDTTLRITLEIVPVEITPLEVQARQVRVRGVVREKASGVWLVDAEVSAPDRKERADPIGRFNLGKFPSGIPVTVQASNFGYLPASLTLSPERDTSIAFELEPDPLMQRMIAVQMERIDRRSDGRRYNLLPVLERADLLMDLNASVAEVIKHRLGPTMSQRIACLIVDEKPFDWRADVMLPDRVERVEVIQYPGTVRRTLMVRVYTRKFVRDLVAGRSELLARERVVTTVPTQCH